MLLIAISIFISLPAMAQNPGELELVSVHVQKKFDLDGITAPVNAELLSTFKRQRRPVHVLQSPDGGALWNSEDVDPTTLVPSTLGEHRLEPKGNKFVMTGGFFSGCLCAAMENLLPKLNSSNELEYYLVDDGIYFAELSNPFYRLLKENAGLGDLKNRQPSKLRKYIDEEKKKTVTAPTYLSAEDRRDYVSSYHRGLEIAAARMNSSRSKFGLIKYGYSCVTCPPHPPGKVLSLAEAKAYMSEADFKAYLKENFLNLTGKKPGPDHSGVLCPGSGRLSLGAAIPEKVQVSLSYSGKNLVSYGPQAAEKKVKIKIVTRKELGEIFPELKAPIQHEKSASPDFVR